MNGDTTIRRQVEDGLDELGAFDATCPGCGKGRAFHGDPRVPDYLTAQPGIRQTIPVVLLCTRCSYPTRYTLDVTWPALSARKAAIEVVGAER
jgi:hypothetical protein